MAITITRIDAAISKQGSGLCSAMEVTATGEALGTPDTYHSLGRMQKTAYSRKATETKDKDAGGVEIVASTATSATLNYVCMQRDKAMLEFAKGMASSYVRFVQELTAAKVNAKQQFLVVACAKPEPSFSVDTSDMYVKDTWNCAPYTGASALTVSIVGVVATTGTLAAGSGTIAVGEYETIIEI